MKRLHGVAILAIAGCFMLSSTAIHAATLTFTANLTGSNEVPPTASTATGTASFILNTTAQTLFISETFSGLGSNTTANHIHCCLASPFLAGSNVGVATLVPAFTGFPLGVTSGTFSTTLDLTSAASYNPGFITTEGSLAAAEAALIAGIENGETYINIHTVNNPGGEIRGFLTPTPEPASMLLLGSGIFGLLGMRRKRHSL
jgi:hypothetical protein